MGSDPRGSTLQEVLRQLFRSGSDHLVHRSEGGFLVVHKDEIVFTPGVKEVCELFQIDPFSSISEGTMIAIARRQAAPEVLRRLHRGGSGFGQYRQIHSDKRVIWLINPKRQI